LDEQRQQPRRDPYRRRGHATREDDGLKAGSRDGLGTASHAVDRQAFAVEEGGARRAVGPDLRDERAAAHGQCRRAGAQRHGIVLLAQLAADIAQEAARRAHRQFSGAALRVIDELIDRQIGIGTDRHRGFIEKQQLGLPGRGGGDVFVENDVLANQQPTRCRAG